MQVQVTMVMEVKLMVSFHIWQVMGQCTGTGMTRDGYKQAIWQPVPLPVLYPCPNLCRLPLLLLLPRWKDCMCKKR